MAIVTVAAAMGGSANDGIDGIGDGVFTAAVAACGPPPNVDRNTLMSVIMNMATMDKLFTRSASFISVRFLTLNLKFQLNSSF